ncbi:hemerythrin domain-containing protein [Sphingomonas sp. BT-65]|uniref:hemerythrin domain-containing protein n=1 Tax=Sphingomonas sp. BT-65 TaxID=2989821 RepID=UPI002235557E|nr:hemerythrin domain-containing protein [Sphingomonas sp. BT-65]MCW4462176.1 hemerythrin domain-containing protein [Sphingomonas sp. BT-65]
MLSFERLIRDHSVIAAAAAALVRALQANAVPAELAEAVERLDAVLTPHVAIEDEQIYPLLLASKDAGQRVAAREAIEAYATLGASWRAFVAKWDEAAIAADHKRFAADLDVILEMIRGRVRSENETLYPMALRAAHIRLRCA